MNTNEFIKACLTNGANSRAGDLLRLHVVGSSLAGVLPGLSGWRAMASVQLTLQLILLMIEVGERRQGEAVSRTFCCLQNADYFTEQNRFTSQSGAQGESLDSRTGMAWMDSPKAPHSSGLTAGRESPLGSLALPSVNQARSHVQPSGKSGAEKSLNCLLTEKGKVRMFQKGELPST